VLTENYFIRALDEHGRRLMRVSPMMFGQRGILNRYFLPKDRDLPGKGLDLKAKVFDFGFNSAAAVLGPFQESDLSIPVRKNFLIWAVMCHRQVQPTFTTVPTEVVPPFIFNIFQKHEDATFQIFNKAIANLEGGGSARKPYLLKIPHLVPSGDSLNVDIQNSGNYSLSAQVVLYGGEFE
jgi:hypothetical protein